MRRRSASRRFSTTRTGFSLSSWGVDCVAALRAAIVRGDARPPSASGFLPGVDDADDASDVWEFDGGMPVDDAADVVEAERLLLGGAASLPDASTSKATTWLRPVTCVLFFCLCRVALAFYGHLDAIDA